MANNNAAAECREELVSKMEEGVPSTITTTPNNNAKTNTNRRLSSSVSLGQKVFAEMIGTYFLIFAGCGIVTVYKTYDQVVTYPGVCVTWGLIVMALFYSLFHVSGAHFNPAVTIAFFVIRRIPFAQALAYIIAQFVGAILASLTLIKIFDVTQNSYFGTLPAGSIGQSFALEIIITFLLMFVICGSATDNRAKGGFAGIAIGVTIMLNVFIAGPVTGASMNPARSIAPAILLHRTSGLWAYIVGPIIGAVSAALVYHFLRPLTQPPPRNPTNVSSNS